MLTRPIGVTQYVSPGFSSATEPVPEANWKYLTPLSSAQLLLAKIRTFGGTNVRIVDADPSDFYWQHQFEGTPNDVREYEIHGTLTVGTSIYQINETAGWLWDRKTNPNPSVDRPRSSSGPQRLGGPNLHFEIVDVGGDVQLYWGA